MTASVERHDDVVASIDATLRKEARRNELLMARVRVGIMAVFSAMEVVFYFEGGSIPIAYRAAVWGYLLASVAFLGVLGRGWFHRLLWLAIPALDTLVLMVRVQSTFTVHDLPSLQGSMELATALGLACVITLSGAFRLRHEAVWVSSTLGLVIYGWFAAQCDLELAQMVVQGAIVMAIGGIAFGLTSQVRRAVRSEVARVTLARFLPETVLSEVHADPVALLTQPRQIEATVLVSDIRGFTAWSVGRDPIEVLAFLNIIQGAIAEVVRQHGGVVDKFMGDGMLAVFGAPKAMDDHGPSAVRAAQQMQLEVARLRRERGVHDGIQLGVGVHTGELVAGCLGSGMRMEFTILGDTVNTASRLESYTKEAGVPVLISQATVDTLDSSDGMRSLGDVTLRGRDEALGIWTFMATES